MDPAALLGMRFLCGLGLLAVGPAMAIEFLVRAGVVAAGATGAAAIEGSMLAWLLACAGVVAFAAWQRPGLPWRPLQPARVLAHYLPFALGWVALLVGYLALARAAGFVVPPQPALEYLAAGEWGRPGFWLVVLGPVLGAPLAEEIVFRGFLQPALRPALGPAGAIVVTAAVFGAVHTLPYALPVGLLGVLFGLLAHRCGSLWPAVLAHALHNSLTVAVTVCWPDSLTWLYCR